PESSPSPYTTLFRSIVDVLEAIVHRLPAPKGDPDAPLKALLMDSWYDAYLGVIVLVRIVDGKLRKGMRVRMMRTGAVHEIDKVRSEEHTSELQSREN